jgi:hypothetical protein
MTNLEYRDMNRFLISLGFATLGVAILAPWLFLRESFDLLLPALDFAKLTPEAQGILGDRREVIALSMKMLPWISLVLAIAGLAMIVVGLWRWTPRQKLLDEEEDIRIAKARHEMQSLSPQQVAAKAAAEVFAAGDEAPATNELESVTSSSDDNVKRYLEVEAKLGGAVEKCLGRNYVVLRNRQIGAAFFDILVQHRSGDGPDLSIEIKYARKGFRYGWVSESALRALLGSTLYAKETGNETRTLIIFVAPRRLLENSPVTVYDRQFKAELDVRGVQADLLFMPEDELDRINCEVIERITGLASPQRRTSGA